MAETTIAGMTLKEIKEKFPSEIKRLERKLTGEPQQSYSIIIPAKSNHGVFYPEREFNVPADNIKQALENFLIENKNIDISLITKIELW